MRWGGFPGKRPADFRRGLNMGPERQGGMPRASVTSTGDICHDTGTGWLNRSKSIDPQVFDGLMGTVHAKTPALSIPSPSAEDAPNPKVNVSLGHGVRPPDRDLLDRRR